ncbi:MAG: DUF1963 domain-containing protein [Myxococcales bacterium]|nr:DUF1963 domain-containing protein [Myxococcales bacterium]
MIPELPELLRPYRAVIESTRRSAVLLSPEPGPTTPRQSKLGGAPYFPADANPDVPDRYHPGMAWTPWPKHPQTGAELQLLLQLDFGQMPRLEPFPAAGILQLFVDDGHWHDLERHLRAVYHPRTDAEPYDFGDVSTQHFRVPEAALRFTAHEEYITRSDFRFDRVYAAEHFGGRSFSERDHDSGYALGRAYLGITDHRYRNDPEVGRGRNKIGGYHYSQNGQDPRDGLPTWEDGVLLAQFQDYEGLSWGDGGSAQFFIRAEDLAALDFSDLLFHWDST